MNTSVQQLPVLRADSLQVGHDGRVVLRCDDLQLFRGEMIALMGASGTGKTTFFSVLAGHAEPLSGRIVTPNGVVHRDWLRKKVARTLQNFPLLHWLTVAQSIRLAAYLRGVSCPDPRMILDQVSAEDLELRLPHTLSGGERCRVSLGMCLLSKPEVLLLDEPFSGLDVLTKKEVAETILAFVERQQCAAIMVTHDLEDAVVYSQRVAVIRRSTPSILAQVWDAGEPDLPRKILRSLT